MSRSAPPRLQAVKLEPGLGQALFQAQTAARGVGGQLVGPRSRVVEGAYNGVPDCFLLQRFEGSAWRTVQAVDPGGNLLIGAAPLALGTGALPAAGAGYEGKFWYVPGGASPSGLYFCTANTGGGYEWGPVLQST